MHLKAQKREDQAKGKTKQMRRDGRIPAVFYGSGDAGRPIDVDTAQFEAALRKIQPNRLSNTVFTIELDGKKTKAIVKDIQYHRTTYKILHLDFEALDDKSPVRLKIPIDCTGENECQGIKLGGVKRQVIRNLKVKCLPKDIPSHFEVDIRHLKMKDSIRLSDIALPKGVESLAPGNEVVVLIAKR